MSFTFLNTIIIVVLCSTPMDNVIQNLDHTELRLVTWTTYTASIPLGARDTTWQNSESFKQLTDVSIENHCNFLADARVTYFFVCLVAVFLACTSYYRGGFSYKEFTRLICAIFFDWHSSRDGFGKPHWAPVVNGWSVRSRLLELVNAV